MVAGCSLLRPENPSVLVVGSWRGAAGDDLSCEALRVAPHDFRFALVRFRPRGIIFGDEHDEAALTKLTLLAQQLQPDVDLAAIGPDEDFDRCERWLARSVKLYLAADCSMQRALLLLRTARENRVVIIDDCFLKERARRAALTRAALGPVTVTKRESDVLRYLRLGFRNAEIARELHLSPRTVHFHVAHILEKLGASNRTDAAERARFLML